MCLAGIRVAATEMGVGEWSAADEVIEPCVVFTIFAAMEDLDLARRLRRLRRTVDMLQTDLRHEHLNETLLADIETQMEHGIATEPRCLSLPALVDALRESAINTRPELYADTIRACEKLKDAIEGITSRLG